jgi:hypothetical protein
LWLTIFDTINQLIIYFDNKAVFKRIKAPPIEPNIFLCMDYDLWQEMQQLERLLLFKIDLNWSKLIERTRMTQERLRSCLTLQLNFQVDAMAGEFRSTMPAHVVPTIRFTAGDHYPAKAIRHQVHGPLS